MSNDIRITATLRTDPDYRLLARALLQFLEEEDQKAAQAAQPEVEEPTGAQEEPGEVAPALPEVTS